MNLALSDVGVIEFHEAFAGTYNTVLHYFALYYTVLYIHYSTLQYCTSLYCIYIILHYSAVLLLALPSLYTVYY